MDGTKCNSLALAVADSNFNCFGTHRTKINDGPQFFLYIFFVFFCFRQMQHTYRGAMCEQAFCVLLCVKRRRRESGEHNLTLTLPVNGVF